MKLIDKMARIACGLDFTTPYINYSNTTQRELDRWRAGFRAAREMCQKHANRVAGQEIEKDRDGVIPCQIAAAFAFMGEEESE
jgi:hypothetical protein